jgi:hypothetical protein
MAKKIGFTDSKYKDILNETLNILKKWNSIDSIYLCFFYLFFTLIYSWK